jgi:nitrite reductase/ring-hydroxylating ferredoxin subunit
MPGWAGRSRSRRLALRWAAWGSLSFLAATTTRAGLSFLKPGWADDYTGTIFVGRIDEFQIGDVRRVGEAKLFVTRVPEGFIALSWRCGYRSCTIRWEEDAPALPGDQGFAQKGRFTCSCRCSQFDRYGRLLQGPGPSTLDRYPVRIENGRIKVEALPSKLIVREWAGPGDAVL